mgnify:CR=1|jgi:hypothetical protein
MENDNKNMKIFFYVIIALVVGLGAFILLKKDKVITDEDYITSEAVVKDIDIRMKESFPVQVDVVVKGEFPDSCYEVGDISQQIIEKTFRVNLEVRKLKDSDVMCTQSIEEFEKVIPLQNVVGLSAGEYIVNVNGLEKRFRFDVDNYITNVDPLK